MQIIDLSQEIFDGMPVYKRLPETKMRVHITHEEWAGKVAGPESSPSVHKISLSEHTGTHVDAINHMAPQYKDQSIDKMALDQFYTEGVCLNLANKSLSELINVEDLLAAREEASVEIKPGDTVLLYTDHYRRHFSSDSWARGPGLSADATRWLGEQKISAFGVETMSPGVSGVSNRAVHEICGELGFTHYENLVNLHLLLGKGRFRFIGLPLKIRGGTGSPVRAVAVIE